MRARLALAMLIGTALPAAAADGFDIVIPGRPGVPVIINGVDASYTVVEGEWGIRSTHVQPTVYGGRVVDPEPNVGHYYPTLGRTPGYGRLEIEPPPGRKLPRPAESFHQSWSAESAPPRAQPEVPFNPPPVLLAPQNREPNGNIGMPPNVSNQSPEPRRPTPRPMPN